MKHRLALGALALVAACGLITEPVCGCQPAGGGTAVITGAVTDPALAPVAGATVKLRLMRDDSCEEPDTSLTWTTQSGDRGRFRHSTSWSGGRKCFRLWAEPPAGSALTVSQSRFVRINFLAQVEPDSLDVTLQLR